MFCQPFSVIYFIVYKYSSIFFEINYTNYVKSESRSGDVPREI